MMAAFSLSSSVDALFNDAFWRVIVCTLSWANLDLIASDTLLYTAINNESGSRNFDTISNRCIANINRMVFLILPLNLQVNFAAPAFVSCICANTLVSNAFVLYNIFILSNG